MHFSKIHIENLLSFENADFEFKSYNVLVGINNSGKTNLLRILKTLSDNGLLGYRLTKQSKFSTTEKSNLTLDLKLDDLELKLLFQSIFQRAFPSNSFPDSLKSIKVVLNFANVISDDPMSTTIIIILNNGMWIVADHSHMVIFNIKLNPKINSDDFLSHIRYFNLNQIVHHLEQKINFTKTDDLPSSFILDKNIDSAFIRNGQNYCFQYNTELKFDYQDPKEYLSEVWDYIGYKKDAVRTIHFSELLSKIIKKNFIPIQEIHPSYDQLTRELFQLKIVNENAYLILQKTFSSIFNGITVRVEQPDPQNNTQRIIISENNKDFEIEKSASGHYAVIHILQTILNKPGAVLLLDEPEVHFHPVKIRQLSQKFMELAKINNNQIIVITHSPKFVDFRLLDPAYPYSLLYMTKDNNDSKIFTLSPKTDIALSPHLFNPEMFFGNCSLLVEGADDEFTIRSISDKFDGILDRFGVTIIDCWGVNHVYPTIQLHKEYHIPYLALVDKEYKENLENVVKLTDKLETELSKTGWSGSKNELKPEIAYYYIQDLLSKKEGFEKLKSTDIWKSFIQVLELSKSELPDFDNFYSNEK